jgi:hypothetical protein
MKVDDCCVRAVERLPARPKVGSKGLTFFRLWDGADSHVLDGI